MGLTLPTRMKQEMIHDTLPVVVLTQGLERVTVISYNHIFFSKVNFLNIKQNAHVCLKSSPEAVG